MYTFSNISDYAVWQLGLTGGTRIIGIRYLNIFRPLFFDYYHLIYTDKNYNQLNYSKYNFCPIKEGEKK